MRSGQEPASRWLSWIGKRSSCGNRIARLVSGCTKPYSRYGVRPQVGAEFDNMESIKRSVIVGNALTILPEYAVL